MILQRNKNIYLLLSVLFCLRLLSLNSMPLYGDEAQYWVWGKNLDWGYYSKPPLLGWLIGFTTIVSDSPFWVRLASPICWLIGAWGVYKAARCWHNHDIAAVAGIAFFTLPGVSFSSQLISTDPPLLAAGAWCLFLYSRALQTAKRSYWIGTGALLGVMTLAKYAGLFYVGALWLMLLSTPAYRQHWPKAFVATFMCLLVLAPNIWWNMQHQFSTLQHTADNANWQKSGLHVNKFLEFFGGQFGVFGLFFASLLMITWRKPSRWLIFVWIILAPMLAQSLIVRAHANWAALAYVAATVVVVPWLYMHYNQWLRRILWVHLSIAFLVPLIFLAYPLFAGQKIDPFKKMRSLEDLPALATRMHQQYPDAWLLTEGRRFTASVFYASKDVTVPIIKWNPDTRIDDHFELTTHLSSNPHQRYLVLVEKPEQLPAITARFHHQQSIAPNISLVYGVKTR